MLPSNGDSYAEQYYFLGDADIHHPPEHDPTSSPAFFAFSPENDEFPFLSPSSDPPALEWDRRSDYYYSSDKQIMDHYHQKQQIAASQEDSLPFNISPSKSKGKAALIQKSTGCSSAVGGGQKRRLAKKDRHSKIVTAHGPRDRRMRLSLQIARKFFDLQDMLGYDKASKTVEWLMAKSRPAIRDLSRGFSTRAAKSASSTSEWEATSGVDETADDDSCKSKPKPAKSSAAADKSKTTRTARKAAQRPHARQSRAMARARARERTREKLLWSRRLEESQQWTEGSPLDESGSRVSHDKNEPSSQSPEQQKGSSVKDLVDDQSAPLSCNSGPAPIFNSISSHELINTHELVSLENHDMINYSFQQNWDMNGTASLQPSFMDGQASNRQWEAYINHSAC